METSVIIYLFSLLIGSFVGSYILFPKIIYIAQCKRLIANPNRRSSHLRGTPNIGGLVFFITMVFGLGLCQDWDYSHVGMSLVVGMLVLFFIGLRDDLMVINPFTKLMAQLVAILLVLINPEFQIFSLHGFLGIEEIPSWAGIPFHIFVMLSVINSFNFIDGIDGLAGIVAIIILVFFGFLFYLLGLYLFAALGMVMIGSLLAFLRFNLSRDHKIFMGDTGSLLIGFLIGAAVLRLFALAPDHLELLPFPPQNLYVLTLAILIVPFFDSIRVTFIRLSLKKSPLSADRNHVHHILLDYFHLSHRNASILIGAFNLIFTCIFFFLSARLHSSTLLGIFLSSILMMAYLLKPTNFTHKTDLKSGIISEVKTE